MSGANAFARPVTKAGPIEERLSLEDNKRIYRFIGTGQVAAAWFIAWALTVKIVIPTDLCVFPPPPPRNTEPPEVTFVIPEKPRSDRKPVKQRPHVNNGPAAVSRNPVEKGGQIKVAEIASRTDDWAKAAYGIINNALKGVDQVKIEGAERLTKTDPTFIAGRRGVKRESYDGPYSSGNGKTNELDLTLPTAPGPIQGEGPKGPSNPGSSVASSITVGSEGRFRSSESILAVVRSHSPGLRHLYNTHLKANPGLGGKVTVRFAVSPSGRVVDAAIVSGTTGSRAFEIQVVEKIQAWRFDPIKALGNDIVTVPFNFSE